MKLIGLMGYKGAGKDTVADMICNTSVARSVTIARPLRDMATSFLQSFGVIPQWENREWKEAVVPEIGVSPRHILETLGTEWGRQHVADDIWLKFATHALEVLELNGVQAAVVTDVRFDNEAQMIVDRGGILVHIDRPECTPTTHSSSSPLWQKFPHIRVENNLGKGELYDAVEALIKSMKIPTARRG